jgi:RNA polymerase sigma factor (sigma-70 family)
MLTLTSEQEFTLIEQAKYRLSASSSPSQQTPEGREIYRRGERAITLLLKQYERFIYQLIHRICPTLEDAYSIALHGFTKALQSYNFRVPLLSWLRIKITGVLLDAVSTQQNRHRRERVLLEHLQAHKAIPNSQDVPLAKEPFEEFMPRLQEALAALSESERLCITLHAEGYQWAEIGELLAKSPDAARMQFNRSLHKLRLALGLEMPKLPKVKVVPKPCWMRTLFVRLKKVVRKLSVGSDITVAISQSEQSHDHGYTSEFIPQGQGYEAIVHKMGQSTTVQRLVRLWGCWRHAYRQSIDRWVVHPAALLRRCLWTTRAQPVPEEDAKSSSCSELSGACHSLHLGECDQLRPRPCAVFQPLIRPADSSGCGVWGAWA